MSFQFLAAGGSGAGATVGRAVGDGAGVGGGGGAEHDASNAIAPPMARTFTIREQEFAFIAPVWNETPAPTSHD